MIGSLLYKSICLLGRQIRVFPVQLIVRSVIKPADIFPALFELKDRICGTEEFRSRDNYQKRALCFLTERVFNFWCYTKKCNGLKIKEVEMIEHLGYKPTGVNERGDFS